MTKYPAKKSTDGFAIFGIVVAAVLGFLGLGLVFAAIGAFPVMIALGILHSFFVAVPVQPPCCSA